MFTYDFRCKSCNNIFEVICSPEERNNNWCCNQCQSKNTVRLFTTQKHFFKGTDGQKGDAYWDTAEKNRIASQKRRRAEHNERYNYDKEFRLKQNRLLHARGIPKENLPNGDEI